MPGVAVLPSSVMSGPPLPLVSALVQSVTRLPQGIQSTTTLVLAYCGYFLWNWVTTPFIQVTCDGTDDPIRQMTSLAGAADEDELPLLPEPQPAAAPASRAAAPNAAADLVSFTRDLPSRLGSLALHVIPPGLRALRCRRPSRLSLPAQSVPGGHVARLPTGPGLTNTVGILG